MSKNPSDESKPKTYKDQFGSLLIGELKDGFLHGKGKEIDRFGNTYEGEFDWGKLLRGKKLKMERLRMVNLKMVGCGMEQ